MEAVEEAHERPMREEPEGKNEREENHYSYLHQRLLSLLLEKAINGDADSEGELSSLISTLHEELDLFLEPSSSPPPVTGEDDVEAIIRWLAEASDDELGIPPTSCSADNDDRWFQRLQQMGKI